MAFEGLPQTHVCQLLVAQTERQDILSSGKLPAASSGFWKRDILTSAPEPSDGAEGCSGQMACKGSFPSSGTLSPWTQGLF